MKQLIIHVNGLFRIEGPSGEDLTPNGAKECALIALLLEGQAGARTRGWLQSHLWSDRGPEQAASSLRQAVYRSKASLKSFEDVLYSNRKNVGLKLDEIEIISNPEYEYLEGIDVRDEEFEYWLATQRSQQSNQVVSDAPCYEPDRHTLSPPQNLTIRVASAGSNRGSATWLGQLLGDIVARSVSDCLDLEIRRFKAGDHGTEGWQLDIDVSETRENSFVLRLVLLDPNSQRILWTQTKSVEAWNEDATQNEDLIELVQQFSAKLNDLILDNLNGSDFFKRPNALCSLGIRKLFTMQPADVAEADRLFSEAYNRHPRGLYLAWLAQVRHIQFVERLRDDSQTLFEEANSFARKSFEREPENSMVLAILAANRLQIARDFDTAMQYAIRAVKKNYGNAVAWWALSATHMVSENPAKSYGAARLAVRLSRGTPLEFWALSQLAGAAMAVKKLGEAKHTLKNVSFGRPSFRPPIRYLLALHATDEEWEDAMAAVGRLQELEPGFSIENFANDRDYPVSLLHRSVGLDRDKVLSLI